MLAFHAGRWQRGVIVERGVVGIWLRDAADVMESLACSAPEGPCVWACLTSDGDTIIPAGKGPYLMSPDDVLMPVTIESSLEGPLQAREIQHGQDWEWWAVLAWGGA